MFGGGDDKEDADDEAADGSIDDPPEQQIWPMPIPKIREKDPSQKIMRFLTGAKTEREETWGKDKEELEPSVVQAHDHAQRADEYAVEAQEAAEDAVRWDKGIVRAVNTADEAWDGAVYAKRVNETLEKAAAELPSLSTPRKDPKTGRTIPNAALERPKKFYFPECEKRMRPKVCEEILEFGRRVDNVISSPGKVPQLNFPFERMEKIIVKAGEPIKPFQENEEAGPLHLLKFLEVKDHPNLYPPQNMPGIMKDGAVVVPLHFPDNPDPMVLEEHTPPDVQERMPPGSLPLDMSNLKGVA